MGYSTNLFVNEATEDLICPICRDVFEDAVYCKDGHTFCSMCIIRWLNLKGTCPIDNKVIIDSNITPNINIRGVIKNLYVYCRPRDENIQTDDMNTDKCDWNGQLKLLPNHRDSCPFQQTECTNRICTVTVQRRNMEDHDRVCRYKHVKCDLCGVDLVRHELQVHKDLDCPEQMVPCPNVCSNTEGLVQKIKRSELRNHTEKLCGQKKVQCPFKDQGCKLEIFRKDFEKHLQENLPMHVSMVAKQNSRLMEENSILVNRCRELSAKLKQSLDDLNTFVWTIHDYPALFKKHSRSYFRSPNFWLCGYSWYVMLYPDGDEDSQGFVSLYLCMNEATGSGLSFGRGPVVPSTEISVSCRFSVKSHSKKTEDVSSIGNFAFSKESPSQGLLQFMRADVALSADHCTSIDGIFILKCSIHHNA